MTPDKRAAEEQRRCVAEALRALGIDNLVLGIHDQSYPSAAGQDTGRGSPYAQGGLGFIRFVRDLGFTGLQFGPSGQTSRDNPSPYDGTIFSRNVLSIALLPLCPGEDPEWGGLLRPETFAAMVAAAPGSPKDRVHHRHVYDAQMAALHEAFDNLRASPEDGDATTAAARARLREEIAAFQVRERGWLEADARHHGGDGTEFYAFCQFIAHRQHQQLRQLAGEWGLKLYGDLQIGLSQEDAWTYRDLLLPGYRMGAPPSRTNPNGQPWNYPILSPALYFLSPDGAPGPALHLMSARMDKLLSEFDGVRLDHPHGLVCPWVYRADDPDPFLAVQTGARLFSSPHLPDHPALARFAIAREDQLNTSVPRYADDWVQTLTPAQVDRYSVLFDTVIQAARRHGKEQSDILCEVLSTLPFPLRRVLDKYGLGRFRVTQKANLKDPQDVYRGENAAPADWIMMGTHDTPPIWLLAERWRGTAAAQEQADYLAARLLPGTGQMSEFASELAADPGKLVHAKFAELFVSPARNVMIFFADLLGLKEVYNTPGTISDDNWTLRVQPDYQRQYREKLRTGEALDLPRALSMALRKKGAGGHHDLLRRLEGLAAVPP